MRAEPRIEKVGTLGALLAIYRDSRAFRDLSLSTRADEISRGSIATGLGQTSSRPVGRKDFNAACAPGIYLTTAP